METLNNNLILNRFFSQVNILKLLKNGKSSVFENCIKQYVNQTDFTSNESIVSNIYAFLKKHYRNEYYYKNTLFNKLIIGRHSLNTTTAITELPINKSKADFIMINGKAVVYEIKTDLDSFERLEQQITDYYKSFPIVYVVTSESNEKKAEKLLSGTNVGLIILTKRSQLSERIKALPDYSRLDKKVIFNIMRKSEFERILENYFGFLPQATPAFYYNECYSLFEKIDIKILYDAFITELKTRNQVDIESYLKYVPYELRFLVYFSESIQKKYKELDGFLAQERGR